jgi:hypothetical protein
MAAREEGIFTRYGSAEGQLVAQYSELSLWTVIRSAPKSYASGVGRRLIGLFGLPALEPLLFPQIEERGDDGGGLLLAHLHSSCADVGLDRSADLRFRYMSAFTI